MIMRKKTIFIVLCCVLAVGLVGCQKEATSQEPKSKEETERTAAIQAAKSGQLAAVTKVYKDGSISWLTYSYDEKGRIISENSVDTKEKRLITTYTYDEQDRVIKVEVKQEEAFKSSVSYEYDSEGHQIKVTSFYEDGSIAEVTEYDASGKITQSISFDEAGEEQVKKVYTYDENGEKSYISTTFQGNADNVERYDYDEMNRLIAQVLYDGNFSVTTRTDYSYSEEGLLIYKESVNGSFIFQNAESYVYDEQGRMTRKNMLSERDKISGYNDYTYDSEDRILENACYDAEGALIMALTNEYDAKGQLLCTTRLNQNREQESKLVYGYREGDSEPVSFASYGADEGVLKESYVKTYDESGALRTITGTNGAKEYTETYYYGE